MLQLRSGLRVPRMPEEVRALPQEAVDAHSPGMSWRVAGRPPNDPPTVVLGQDGEPPAPQRLEARPRLYRPLRAGAKACHQRRAGESAGATWLRIARTCGGMLHLLFDLRQAINDDVKAHA